MLGDKTFHPFCSRARVERKCYDDGDGTDAPSQEVLLASHVKRLTYFTFNAESLRPTSGLHCLTRIHCSEPSIHHLISARSHFCRVLSEPNRVCCGQAALLTGSFLSNSGYRRIGLLAHARALLRFRNYHYHCQMTLGRRTPSPLLLLDIVALL